MEGEKPGPRRPGTPDPILKQRKQLVVEVVVVKRLRDSPQQRPELSHFIRNEVTSNPRVVPAGPGAPLREHAHTWYRSETEKQQLQELLTAWIPRWPSAIRVVEGVTEEDGSSRCFHWIDVKGPFKEARAVLEPSDFCMRRPIEPRVVPIPRCARERVMPTQLDRRVKKSRAGDEVSRYRRASVGVGPTMRVTSPHAIRIERQAAIVCSDLLEIPGRESERTKIGFVDARVRGEVLRRATTR